MMQSGRLANFLGLASKGLRRLLFARKSFRKPPQADIAVFDSHTADCLCKVLGGYSVFAIDIRGESLNLPILLYSCFDYLKLRGKRKFLISYYSRFISISGAKICITNQDANEIFFDLARQNEGVRFIALQQGMTKANPDKIFGDYYAFSPAFAGELGGGKATIHIAGSLKANSAEFDRGKYSRMCYISNYVGHPLTTPVFRNYNYAEYVYPSIYNLLRMADAFCSGSRIELVMATKGFREKTEAERRHVLENERHLFGNVLGREATVIEDDPYKVAGESRLVITEQSALGYELLGRGCKVVFLNFSSYFIRQPQRAFGWPLDLPDQGPFWSNIPDPAYVTRMLDNVWHMSREEWDNVSKTYRDQLMHYDRGNSILHAQLRAILGEPGMDARQPF